MQFVKSAIWRSGHGIDNHSVKRVREFFGVMRRCSCLAGRLSSVAKHFPDGAVTSSVRQVAGPLATAAQGLTSSASVLDDFDPFVRPSQRGRPASRPPHPRPASALPAREKARSPTEDAGRVQDDYPRRRDAGPRSAGSRDKPHIGQGRPWGGPPDRRTDRQHGDQRQTHRRPSVQPQADAPRDGRVNEHQSKWSPLMETSDAVISDADDEIEIGVGSSRRKRNQQLGRDRDRERRERRLLSMPQHQKKGGARAPKENPDYSETVNKAQRADGASSTAPRQVVLRKEVSVKSLAAVMGASAARVEEILKELGELPKSSEDLVSFDTAELACLEADIIAICQDGGADDQIDAVPRPAVVAVMGHVDHGKTSLLDALRNTSVAASEAGGITQHVGAFEVDLPNSGRSLTFLDTPGHAAFSAMRARGAAVTDIVVLVVAADDSVMPQTIEAISHARAAKCPIVVALSKVDLATADPDRVMQDLALHGLDLEVYGGEIPVVKVSAPSGVGLRDLEEALLFQAELLNVRASENVRFEGTVVEAKLDKGQGALVTLIVNRGVLRVGQFLVAGTHWGKVRSIRTPGGALTDTATPGKPAVVSGLKGVPMAGDEVTEMASEERARRISVARAARAHDYRLARLSKTTAMARLHAEAEARAAALKAEKAARKARRNRRFNGPVSELAGVDEDEDQDFEPATLPVIIKGDVQGSLEAVESALAALSGEQATVHVVHAGVGPVSSSDVSLASVTGAQIVAFNVRPDKNAVVKEAKAADVEIKQYRVIYHLLEDLGTMLAGAAPRVQEETVTGQAQVQQTFEINKRGKDENTVIAGCKVTSGTVHWQRSKAYRVVRAGDVVHEGLLQSLKREKTDVQEVVEGKECGLILQDFNNFKVGDVLHCICVEERAPKTERVVGGGLKVVEKGMN